MCQVETPLMEGWIIDNMYMWTYPSWKRYPQYVEAKLLPISEFELRIPFNIIGHNPGHVHIIVGGKPRIYGKAHKIRQLWSAITDNSETSSIDNGTRTFDEFIQNSMKNVAIRFYLKN